MNQDTRTLPAPIGAALAGGYFAGLISVGWETYALIVAPKADGETISAWHTTRDSVAGAEHYSDGLANTNAMAAAGSPLAQWARGLRIGGFDDWYIPSRDELELMYRNLKPTGETNCCSFRDGDNPSSVPVGYPYTEQAPAQTACPAFAAGGAEALEPKWHWSSTQYAANPGNAWYQVFDGGDQDDVHKSAEGRARAVRRFKI